MPKIVAKELGRVEKLDSKLKEFERGCGVKIKRLSPKESVDFCRLAQSKSNNIGAGEAAVIAMASSMRKDSKMIGIIGSNNLSDVAKYSKERKIKIMTTGKILIEVERRDILNKKQIEKIWRSMIRYNAKLGAKSYEKFRVKEKKRIILLKN